MPSLVDVGVGELERELGGLDVEGEDDAVGPLDQVLALRDEGALAGAAAPHRVPARHEDGKVDGNPAAEKIPSI